jgi:sugar/nucleoside kinase (ribokinase family)
MRTLCVGEVSVDLVREQAGGTTDAFVARAAGSAAAVAIAAAGRGADVALAGRVGDDLWGRWLTERLRAAGVGLDHLGADTAVATPVTFRARGAGGRVEASRYGGADRDRWLGLEAAVLACQALCLCGGALREDADPAAVAAAHARARSAGLPVVLVADLAAGAWRSASAAVEVVGPFVPGALLVVATAGEARALTGEPDAEAAAASLVAAGAEHAVVLPDEGGVVLRGSVRRRVPGEAADAATTAGALVAALARTGYYPPALAASLTG